MDPTHIPNRRTRRPVAGPAPAPDLFAPRPPFNRRAHAILSHRCWLGRARDARAAGLVGVAAACLTAAAAWRAIAARAAP